MKFEYLRCKVKIFSHKNYNYHNRTGFNLTNKNKPQVGIHYDYIDKALVTKKNKATPYHKLKQLLLSKEKSLFESLRRRLSKQKTTRVAKEVSILRDDTSMIHFKWKWY